MIKSCTYKNTMKEQKTVLDCGNYLLSKQANWDDPEKVRTAFFKTSP